MDTTAIVLAGGRGTRLAKVLTTTPKPLATVAGRPFLEWQLRYLRGQGITEVVVSIGYLAEKVEAFVEGLSLGGLRVSCVKEVTPLGTAGGFINALGHLEDGLSSVLVSNGDSLLLARLRPVCEAVEGADAAMLAVAVRDGARFGTLRVEAGRLASFDEKKGGTGLINGGVYVFRRNTIARFPRKVPLSFEYDVFPALLASGARIAVVPCDAPFLDIGTEQTLAQADAFIKQNMSWFE